MKTCTACCLEAVNPEDPPRYDVLAETTSGPYCPECWPSTITGSTTNE